jgi:hypothetical protein
VLPKFRIEVANSEYPYPHEISEILPKVRAYDEIVEVLKDVQGDSSKIPQDLKRIDAMYGIWSYDELLAENSPFAGQRFSSDQEELIRRHKVAVYGCFLSTATKWALYQKDCLKIRSQPLLMKGGLSFGSLPL